MFLLRSQLCLVGLGIFIVGLEAQDCFISEDIIIQPNASTNLVLNISGLINDDLSSDQEVCEVRLVFRHERLENIRMTLTSPSGQEVSLIGPARIASVPTPFINWNVSFNRCAVGNMPDAGLAEVWDNTDAWASFSNYNGVYDPHLGCLEDFNMGSANGSWSLSIENLGDFQGLIQYFEIIFCDGTGLSCEPCVLFPGAYEFESPGGVVDICVGQSVQEDLLAVDVSPELSSEQAFAYIYKSGDDILSIESNANETENLAVGVYEICGLAFDESQMATIMGFQSFIVLEEALQMNEFCAAVTSQCVTLRVLDIENIEIIDTIFCNGDTIAFRDFLITEDLDTMIYLPGISNTVCDSLIEFHARMQTVESIISNTSDEVVCGQSIFLNGIQSTSDLVPLGSFEWLTNGGNYLSDVGPVAELNAGGEYQLVVTAGNCQDTSNLLVTETTDFDLTVNIESINCEADSSVVNLTAPQGTSFSFTPDQFGTVDENTFFTYEAGAFDVEATFGTCVETQSFNIVRDVVPIDIMVEVDTIDCNSTFAQVNVEANTSISTLMIMGPESVLTDQTTFSLGSPGIYTLLLTDSGSCTAEAEFEIIEDSSEPVYSVDDLVIDCRDAVPAFAMMIGSAFDSIVWSGPGGFESTLVQTVPDMAGVYSFQIYGSNGCESAGEVEFEIINSGVSFDIEASDLDCVNPIVEICIESNEAIDSIVWPDGSISVDCYNVEEEGQYGFEIFSGRCSDSGSFSIIDLRENIDFTLNLGSGNLDCDEDRLEVGVELGNVIGNYEVEWYQGNTLLGQGDNIELMNAGTFSVLIRDLDTGCEDGEVFEINERPNSLLDFELEIVQPVCFPEMGILRMDGLPINTVFGIFLNDEVLDLRELPDIELLPGIYDFEIEDENGCRFMESFEIVEGNRVELDLGEDIEAIPLVGVELKGESNLALSQISQINWFASDSLQCDECLMSLYYPVQSQEVVLEIVDEDGCVARDSVRIDINEDQIYFIPNIFSPNEDGDNDDLEIYLSDAINKVFDFRIFDRWGNLLLFRPEISGGNSNFVWDGYFNGVQVEIGVYTYMAKLLLVDGSERQVYGQISLVR